METTEQDRCNTSETGENIWFTFTRRHFFSLAGWGMLSRCNRGLFVSNFWI